jgi:hypothetical protein
MAGFKQKLGRLATVLGDWFLRETVGLDPDRLVRHEVISQESGRVEGDGGENREHGCGVDWWITGLLDQWIAGEGSGAPQLWHQFSGRSPAGRRRGRLTWQSGHFSMPGSRQAPGQGSGTWHCSQHRYGRRPSGPSGGSGAEHSRQCSSTAGAGAEGEDGGSRVGDSVGGGET